MSKHTPGPWEWHWREGDEDNPGSVVSLRHPGMPYAVAMCPKYRGPGNPQSPWDADARLIAAAPTMLEALKKLHVMADNTATKTVLDVLAEAIAKAEGGAS